MVRKLASEGHEVYAADDQSLSPGNHSRYLMGRFVYAAPRRDTAGFLAALERIAREYEIDVIGPTFEEAFYISTQLERLLMYRLPGSGSTAPASSSRRSTLPSH